MRKGVGVSVKYNDLLYKRGIKDLNSENPVREN